jgi:putative DNA primase/helicase
VKAAIALAEHIKARKLGGTFTLRDVYFKGWTGLSDPVSAKVAADILEDAKWIRLLDSTSSDPLGRGRPSMRYQVNPRIWS